MGKKDRFQNYNSKNISSSERNLIESWFLSYDSKVTITDEELERRLANLDRKVAFVVNKPNKPAFPYLKIAASFLLISTLSFAAYFYVQNPNRKLANLEAPHGLNSIIQLNDQKAINLNDIRIGDTLASQGYAITKLSTGEIKYLKQAGESSNITNKIYTKPGDITSIILSDGTKVAINANSTLTYPIELNDEYRSVNLEGEAYFEVTSAAKLNGNPPFYVVSKNQTVMVTGTRFNVNTYHNKYTATLFEGKIGMANQHFDLTEKPHIVSPLWMKPNHQYKYQNGKATLLLNNNIEAVLDWKNGIFDFNELTINEVCDKISNWYGVQFHIDENAANRRYYGQISKTNKLSQVLHLLAMVNDLKFEIEHGSIHVSQK